MTCAIIFILYCFPIMWCELVQGKSGKEFYYDFNLSNIRLNERPTPFGTMCSADEKLLRPLSCRVGPANGYPREGDSVNFNDRSESKQELSTSANNYLCRCYRIINGSKVYIEYDESKRPNLSMAYLLSKHQLE